MATYWYRYTLFTPRNGRRKFRSPVQSPSNVLIWTSRIPSPSSSRAHSPAAWQTVVRSRFSRTSGDGGSLLPCPAIAGLLGQAACLTRALSNANPARPYICRLIIFTCWTDYTDRHTPCLGRYSGCTRTFSDRSPEPGELAPASPGGHPEGSTMPRTTRTRRLH